MAEGKREEVSGDDSENQNVTKKLKLTEATEDESTNRKIVNQLDYYFSDVNVVHDKFLLEEFKKDEGWVKLSTLMTFSRLKALANEESKLIEALKECESDIVELDEEKKQVRRKNPLPDLDEYRKELDSRTLHLSGFPSDYTFEPLHKWCSQYGEVESLSMRNHFKTRQFKGNILVVFKSKVDAEKLMAIEDLKCKDRELRKENMEQYRRRKEEMFQKRVERRQERKGKKAAVSSKTDPEKLIN